jgi:hypothetical protein
VPARCRLSDLALQKSDGHARSVPVAPFTGRRLPLVRDGCLQAGCLPGLVALLLLLGFLFRYYSELPGSALILAIHSPCIYVNQIQN